jgi:hypothetical protein
MPANPVLPWLRSRGVDGPAAMLRLGRPARTRGARRAAALGHDQRFCRSGGVPPPQDHPHNPQSLRSFGFVRAASAVVHRHRDSVDPPGLAAPVARCRLAATAASSFWLGGSSAEWPQTLRSLRIFGFVRAVTVLAGRLPKRNHRQKLRSLRSFGLVRSVRR